AASRLMAPVPIASTRTRGESAPIRMMAPLPQVFSIWVMARFRAFLRSSVSFVTSFSAAMGSLDIGWKPPFQRPEYKPKRRLPPSRAERVRDMLQLIINQCDTVKTVDVRRTAVAIHPDPGGRDQLPPFHPGHALQRAAEPVPAPRRALAGGERPALPGDRTDLRVAGPESLRPAP